MHVSNKREQSINKLFLLNHFKNPKFLISEIGIIEVPGFKHHKDTKRWSDSDTTNKYKNCCIKIQNR